jgi:hypothetical protein
MRWVLSIIESNNMISNPNVKTPATNWRPHWQLHLESHKGAHCGYETGRDICNLPGVEGVRVPDCANCTMGTQQARYARLVHRALTRTRQHRG